MSCYTHTSDGRRASRVAGMNAHNEEGIARARNALAYEEQWGTWASVDAARKELARQEALGRKDDRVVVGLRAGATIV